MFYEIDYTDKKEIGDTGEKVSAIGLGTWAIRDYSQAYNVFLYAFNNGIDNVDTAEMYDNGKAEEFVGRVVREYGREHIFITTKMMPHHLISSEKVLRAGRKALARMNISYVDLYLIHWPNREIPVETQIRNFEILIEHGITRYIGVSNFSLEELVKAIYATRKTEIVVNQIHYSVLNREAENDILPFAIEKKITIQAYTPLEKGYVKNIKLLHIIGEKHGKTPVQVALNYLIAHPRVIAIPKTENQIHLQEIIGSMGWRLDREDIELIVKNI